MNEEHEDFSLDSHEAWDAATAQQRRRAIEREIAICKAHIVEPAPKRNIVVRLLRKLFMRWSRTTT